MSVTYFTDKLSGSLTADFKPTGTKHSAMVTMLFYNIQKQTQNVSVFRKSINIQEPKLSPPPHSSNLYHMGFPNFKKNEKQTPESYSYQM
jgi:hypothetical protein